MKKTAKKLLVYLLAVSMVITYIPTTAFAFEGDSDGPGPVSLEQTVDGTTVTVDAEAGVLPEDAGIDVTLLDDEELAAYAETVEADLEDEVLDGPAAIEVKFLDGEGEEIQPDGDVDLTISDSSFTDRADGLSVFFFEDNAKYEDLSAEAKDNSAVWAKANRSGVYLVTGMKEKAKEAAVAESADTEQADS